MTRHARMAAVCASFVVALLAVGTSVTPVLGYSFAARASLTPTQMYVGDSSGTLLTFTVHNTGTRHTIGAVQISRPFSFWQVLSCPSAPSGWSAVATADDCQYLSQSGAADDIARGASATFTLTAATSPSISNRTGTWRVVVSQTNSLADPGSLKQAAAQTPGLKVRAYSFELTDFVMADAPATVGVPCPSSNHAASGNVVTLVACGVNHTNGRQRVRQRYAHLNGNVIDDPGTFHGGSIAPTGDTVVLGNWSNVTLRSGADEAITAQVGAWPGRTSPSTTIGGYSTPAAGQVQITPSSPVGGGKDGQFAKFIEHVKNTGAEADTYAVSASGGSWTATVYDATCTTPVSSTGTVNSGDSVDVCIKVDVPGDASEQDTSDTTFSATSTSDSSITDSAILTAMAVQFDTLLVDEDTNDPVDSAPYYKDALDANGVDYGYWDLSENADLPASYLNAHINVIWFTGNTDSAPLSTYESELTAYLDGGGRLMMSGQDILDGAAGQSTFVHDYLHIDWDGTETQNDKPTTAVHSVAHNSVTDGIGAVPIDHSVLNTAAEDQITPIYPGLAAYVDDNSGVDALTASEDGYKVFFLAFPFEAYGNATQRADLVERALTWFGA